MVLDLPINGKRLFKAKEDDLYLWSIFSREITDTDRFPAVSEQHSIFTVDQKLTTFHDQD